MRSKTSKTRNCNSKSRPSKKIEQKIAENGGDMDTNGEPLPTLPKAAYKMTVVRPNEWYDLLNIRYYEHVQKMFYNEWTDTIDKEGNVLLETQVKVFKQIKKNSTNDIKTEEESNQTLFNESIPPKSNILYVLTLYHTTNTLLIQGNLRVNWVNEEYPLSETVLNKRKEQESSMLEAYNHAVEIPTLTTNKELNQEPNITTSINEENPGKIPTMIPQIIITPPLKIISENNTDIPQPSPNPITSEQSNLTTNNENINEHTVRKINHSFGIKEASQNALDKIELLNTQTLDSNTLTKNKVKETKTALENKFEEINTNIFNVKQSLKKLESKQKDMNNSEKNNNNINKQNLKITKEATIQTETQIEDKPPALFGKLAHNDTDALYKVKETYIS